MTLATRTSSSTQLTSWETYGVGDLCCVRMQHYSSCCFGGMTYLLLILVDVNTEIADLKAAVVAMIKAGHPVFFGCDVGQFSDRTAGIMDTALHQYEVHPISHLMSIGIL